jgi:hypothetical protein
MKILGFRIKTDPTTVGPVATGVNWYEHDDPKMTLACAVLAHDDCWLKGKEQTDDDRCACFCHTLGPVDTDVPDDGLTPEERVVSDALLLAFQEFMKLPTQHPDERRDFVDGIHQCQNQLMWRIVRRAHPRAWPIKQEEER